VREMESIFELATPEMTTGFSALPSESAAPTAPRNRIRN
jgi:O-acetyl-ADP-ribose deacetylase (regulator of RNase III)